VNSVQVAAGGLTDAELLRGFEHGTLEGGAFHHAEHIRVAWLYLGELEPVEALDRYVANIKEFARINGAPEKYHETITWAYLLLIRERLEPGETWEEFVERNGDLMDWQDSILARYYSPELLGSEVARQRFVFPDRLG